MRYEVTLVRVVRVVWVARVVWLVRVGCLGWLDNDNFFIGVPAKLWWFGWFVTFGW